MAVEAERLLQGTGWLPEPLRTASLDVVADAEIFEAAEVEALPNFLMDDEGDAPIDPEEDKPHVVAAE